jgi:hypothetical protein
MDIDAMTAPAKEAVARKSGRLPTRVLMSATTARHVQTNL